MRIFNKFYYYINFLIILFIIIYYNFWTRVSFENIAYIPILIVNVNHKKMHSLNKKNYYEILAKLWKMCRD